MEPVDNSSTESPLGTRSVYESSHLLGHSVFTGTSQEPFSMSSVPSAFSVIGHGFPTANRTPGSEFGGLGSLRNESLPSPSSTSTASHNPMSPSGGATWWTQPHGAVPSLGLSGSSLGLTGSSLGLTPSFSSLSKDSSVKHFESLFTGNNHKHVNEYLGYPSQTPASPPTAVKPSPSGAPSGEKRGRGRPRKSDSPRHADTSIGNSHTDVGTTSTERAKYVATEKRPKNGPLPMEVTEATSERSSSNREGSTAFEPSGSEHSLENKKDISSSSDIDMEEEEEEEDEEEEDEDVTTSDDLEGTNDSENSELSSNDNDTDDSDEEEEEMESIMKTKKELELKQKELLEQEKKIKQQQQEARERKKKKVPTATLR